MKLLLTNLKYKGRLGFIISLVSVKIYKYLRYNRLSDKEFLRKSFKFAQLYDLNLANPTTFNEKLQWLKLNDKRDLNSVLTDKYAVRDFISVAFGSEYLIPLLGSFTNPDDLNLDVLPDVPFIIKPNHSSGDFVIVRNKWDLDLNKLVVDCKWWLSFNYFYPGRQWQYKSIKRRIIVEKLLLTREGKIPNDYKFHCFNGRAEFIYVAVDREGLNVRQIYDLNWEILPFSLEARTKVKTKRKENINVEPPKNLAKMIDFAQRISKIYAYVRVDFYEVDGKLFFGEVTHHHGGGYDQLKPFEWDEKFGNIMNLKLEL